jgi:hypothetical protein
MRPGVTLNVSWQSTCRSAGLRRGARSRVSCEHADNWESRSGSKLYSLSLGKVQRELSWHGLLQPLRGRASAAEAEAQLQADVATLAASWTTIRRYLQRRGIRYPRMMMVNPRRPPVLWLVPITITRNPGWLEPLRRVLPMVESS